jgi:membrane fusion protein (multidrug efflux system)
MLIVLTLGALAIAIGATLWWRSHGRIETDNAYVSGHVHPVSTRSAGVVTKVLVEDNEMVREGQVLVMLDAADADLKVEQVQAQVKATQMELAENDAQAAQALAQRLTARAQVEQVQAQVHHSQQTVDRVRTLYSDQMKAVSKAEVDDADAALAVASADLRARRDGGLRVANAQVEAARSAREAINARIALLGVALKDARQQRGYLQVVSPAAGRIGARSVEVGTHVQPGQQLAAVVQPQMWIIANFKETQLAQLSPGLAVKVRIDALPDLQFLGRVDSVAPATGAQFALLPPDNATGNFNKVVQRVPVKILLTAQDLAKAQGRLVAGMSAVVEIEPLP